ncbi:MAG: hypothetical protein ABSG43_23645, partial [Solirubrobacteraceae bacterium]
SHACLPVAADWAASKHLGDSRSLGKAGPRANPATRRKVDNTAMPEFGDLQVRGVMRVETRIGVRAGTRVPRVS